MATSSMTELIDQLRKTALLREGAGLTDGQLLEEYVSRHDAAALAALVQRHGPMVWGVCRRVISNYHDAEDAFQATFLVLARKATSVMPREMVANWLYGVAHQTALKARATAGTRKGRERQVVEMPEPAVAEPAQWDELLAVLDEELSRLPDKYRAIVVLCDLEGKTRREAARQLGVPDGTAAGWSARARVMLAKRLAERGIALSAGMLAAVLSQNVASAGVPSLLVSSTIKAASVFAAGQATTAGAMSASVAALTEGVLKTMLFAKLKTVTVMLLVVAMVGFGTGLLCYGTAVGQQGDANKIAGTVPQKENGQPKAQKDEQAIQGTWYVLAMEEGGKPQPKDRFEDVKMRFVVKGDKLSIMTTTLDGRDVGEQGITFTLDGKASPKHLNASKDGSLLFGIYAFEKEHLRLCIDLEGAMRPSGFTTAEGTRQRSYILQKKDAIAEPEPAVSLLLQKGSAERWEQEIHFRCEVVLDNAMGRDLAVRSNFGSVFDGLQVVVTTPKGKVLAQQGYTQHQAPYAPPGRVFSLKKGETTSTLIFPISGLPKDMRSVKVRLVGTLPGSNYDRLLSSETLPVEVKDRAR